MASNNQECSILGQLLGRLRLGNPHGFEDKLEVEEVELLIRGIVGIV